VVEGLNVDGTPNTEAAIAKMEEAKTACPAIYELATGDGLKFDHGDTPTWAKLVSIWIESLKAAGIVLKSNPIEPSAYYPTIMNPETQGSMSRSGWGPDWANASTVIPELFCDCGGFNLSQNSEDPAYAAFAEKAKCGRNSISMFWIRFGRSQDPSLRLKIFGVRSWATPTDGAPMGPSTSVTSTSIPDTRLRDRVQT
jgi:hypothetical protein